MTGGWGSRSGVTAAPTSRGNSALCPVSFPRGSLTIDAGDQAPVAALGGSPCTAARAAEPRSEPQAAAPPHRSAPSSGQGPRTPDLGWPSSPPNPAAAAPFPATALPRTLGGAWCTLGVVVHAGSCRFPGGPCDPGSDGSASGAGTTTPRFPRGLGAGGLGAEKLVCGLVCRVPGKVANE